MVLKFGGVSNVSEKGKGHLEKKPTFNKVPTELAGKQGGWERGGGGCTHDIFRRGGIRTIRGERKIH